MLLAETTRLVAPQVGGYTINKMTASAGTAPNRMKRAWLFARCGVTGLILDDADLFLLLLQTFHERNQFRRQFLWRVASGP
jgi:hypothetical protein